ncbi:MAG: PilT/PilU family type 4a pilus ATPase [Planctomycetota bacterium]|nr:PilT/PilU family type 4a pilus ATPase [Planctomycetota bacterium]
MHSQNRPDDEFSFRDLASSFGGAPAQPEASPRGHAGHAADASPFAPASFTARGPTPSAPPPPPPSAAPRAAQRGPARISIEEAVKDLLAVTSYSSPRHQLEAWLAVMCKIGASDLILRAGGRPSHRTDGKIGFLPGRVPDSGPLVDVLEGILGKLRMDDWRVRGSADASLHLDGLGRFRLNAYRQMGEPAVVIRRINENAPNLDDLDLPTETLKKLAMRKRGLILVTGIAGSGKSTTLAGMIQSMNESVERHVVTLEDPVELLFKEQFCVISQREVGTDCTSFQDGLRHALRQSPDVILIGEMRDAETVIAALDATETGHLVMSTLHTVNAPQTVERILSFFRPEQHQQVRLRLAENLAAVLSQRLIPRSGGKGMIPAFELMQTTPHIRELLMEGKTSEMSRVIEQGTERGLVSFNMCLRKLVQDRKVELNDALAASDRPEELILALRGITGSSARVDNNAAHQKAPPGQDGLRIARS